MVEQNSHFNLRWNDPALICIAASLLGFILVCFYFVTFACVFSFSVELFKVSTLIIAPSCQNRRRRIENSAKVLLDHRKLSSVLQG